MMTLKEFRIMTRGMSPDTVIAMSTPTDIFAIDNHNSGVENIEDEETGETKEVLLLKAVGPSIQLGDRSGAHLYIVD